MRDHDDADRAFLDRVGNVELIRREMGRGIREALLQHKRAGNPIATWRDGQVVWIPPEEIPTDFDDEDEALMPPTDANDLTDRAS